ncbi:MAG: HEAT repeat domain-containing protein [Dehalococcoidales bacterium]|nr:HEAT repeat domain-containing protein [Dehalococcoidales bacterium]
MSLAEILTGFRNDDGDLPDSSLVELSELDSEEMALLAQSWDDIAPERRSIIISRLVELADSNVTLNFHAVFKHCLGDTYTEVRKEAVRGLWECEKTSLIESLIGLLEEDPSEAVQAEAARALGRFVLLVENGTITSEYASRIAHTLLNITDDSTRPMDVRRQALEAVAPLSLPEVRTAIGDNYLSRDDRLRISSVRAMGRSCDPSWLPVLLRELGSADAEMRREVAEALGGIEGKDTVPQLAELIYDDDVDVKLATIRSLGNIGDAEASECLKQCLDDPNEAVSQTAEEALQELVNREDMSSFLI